MGKCFLITHGFRGKGYNPRHTAEGIAQIYEIAKKLLANGQTHFPALGCGTGSRFLEIRKILKDMEITWGFERFHALIGSEPGLDAPNIVRLVDDVNATLGDTYLTLSSSTYNPWAMIAQFPSGSIFCSGGELVTALGEKPVKGRLFEVDLEARTITDITNE